MWKEKDIVMLPTYNKSDLVLFGNQLRKGLQGLNPMVCYYQHLYILSDEEIKDGDWFIRNNKLYNEIKETLTPKVTIKIRLYNDCETAKLFGHDNIFVEVYRTDCKKIIATTDTSLKESAGWRMIDKEKREILQELPKIPESFITLFIKEYNKGNIIEKVEVEYDEFDLIEGGTDYIPKGLIELKLYPDNTINIRLKKRCRIWCN